MPEGGCEMKKVIIMGCSGSGKSTLAVKLGKKLDIDVYHLDKIWWYGNWQNISEDEFKTRLGEIMKNESWIIDGNYRGTLDMRLEGCDTVIYLDYNVIYCLINVIWRYFKNIGRVRADMGGECVEKLDFEFIGFILNFNRMNRREIYKSLENCNKDIYTFRSRRKLNKWMENFKDEQIK